MTLSKRMTYFIIFLSCLIACGVLGYLFHQNQVLVRQAHYLQQESTRLTKQFTDLDEKRISKTYYPTATGRVQTTPVDLNYQLLKDVLTKMFSYRSVEQFKEQYAQIVHSLVMSDYVSDYYGNIDDTASSIAANDMQSLLDQLTLVKESDTHYFAIFNVYRYHKNQTRSDVEPISYRLDCYVTPTGFQLKRIQ